MIEALALVTASVCCAGVLLVASLKNFRKARLIEDIPTAKVRSCAQGFAELSGTAKVCDNTPLVSPLSGDICLWYRIKIEEQADRQMLGAWKTLQQKTSTQEFMLDDGSGECAVYPQNAEIKPALKRRWHGTSLNPNSPYPLAAHLISTSRYRYTEETIKEGDYLYVLGQFKTHHAGSLHQQAKQNMATLIVDWKRDYPRLLARFDTNGDGEICMEEWQQAQQAAYEEAYESVKRHHQTEGLHLMVAPPSPLPFIVSTYDPKHLCKRYRLYSYGCLSGIGACLGLCAYLLTR